MIWQAGVRAFLPAGRIYRANGAAASQFPDDPGLWPPLRRAMISTPIPLPRFPVRRLKVGPTWWSKFQATRSTAQLAVRACSEVLPDFPPSRPAPDYGPRPQPLARATASALLRGPAAPARYLQTVHTHETLPRTPPFPRALVIFGKGQRAAASCLEPRGGFLGNLSCGCGAGNLGQGWSQGQATGCGPR